MHVCALRDMIKWCTCPGTMFQDTAVATLLHCSLVEFCHYRLVQIVHQITLHAQHSGVVPVAYVSILHTCRHIYQRMIVGRIMPTGGGRVAPNWWLYHGVTSFLSVGTSWKPCPTAHAMSPSRHWQNSATLFITCANTHTYGYCLRVRAQDDTQQYLFAATYHVTP